MDWSVVVASVLAGGIVGQVFTVLCTNYLTKKREYEKWRLIERYKAITALFDILTSNPHDATKLSQWTHEVRNASMKIHFLYKNGIAPEKVAHALEVVFKLVQKRKESLDDDNWSSHFKSSVSNLRKELSNNLDVE
ncbi:hypothetical protein [Vibrio sp. 10N.222.49.B4]|uniref:hypothetical protein n=1 Tax=Vibrio sp. 10N.222.49.B4 TaxID=3229613 RepID=UPI00355133CE